ncbi:MAG: hypothetical protein U9O96_01865 [Candidatus Thermoplasmatota archaeon]|nr:hypothetical protein [Candidatus Thermoplasmatota archaeon]
MNSIVKNEIILLQRTVLSENANMKDQNIARYKTKAKTMIETIFTTMLRDRANLFSIQHIIKYEAIASNPTKAGRPITSFSMAPPISQNMNRTTEIRNKIFLLTMLINMPILSYNNR